MEYEEGGTMSEEENKEVVRRHYEGWNTGDVGVCQETLALDYALHVGGSTTRVESGPDLYACMLPPILSALPDIHLTIEDLFADGDKVVVRTSASATLRGELRTRWGTTFPPTGKRLTWTEICIYRLAGGKIAEEWWETDWAGILVQLGVVPAPPGS